MQPDVSTSPTAGRTRTHAGEAAGGYQPPTNVSSAIDAVSSGVSQAVDYVSEQARTRPLVVASLAAAIVGAIVGSRIAQIQAMRHRKNAYQRAMDALGNLTPLIAGLTMMGRGKPPIDILRERGEDVADITGSMMGGMPIVGRARQQAGGPAQFARQVGYAASLVPVTMALLRNPMVRDIGFRLLSRRIRGR
ncbi:MAG: hypothetical protein ACYC3V_03030 [Chloroflexota bacterium]